MTASVELKSKKELIKQILTEYPETRDSDRELCVKIWQKEMMDYGVIQGAFFHHYEKGNLTSADSISRLKRLIQKEHPELRGIDKKDEQEKVLQALEYKTDLFQ